MHTGGVLHRDMKPSNLLLNAECLMKVCDLGLARSIASLENDQSGGAVLTDYVATRWYRAPEILLGSTKYTKAVDMWSVGCIIGELCGGKPMFPGTSTIDQLSKIISITGRPSSRDIDDISSPFAGQILDSITDVPKKTLKGTYPSASKEAIDLMKKLLAFNPKDRLSAEEALKHPYLEDFSDPENEPSYNGTIKISVDDNTKLSLGEYRQQLYAEIAAKKERKKQRREEARRKKSAQNK